MGGGGGGGGQSRPPPPPGPERADPDEGQINQDINTAGTREGVLQSLWL